MRSVLRFLRMAEYGGDELLIALLACASSAYALCTWWESPLGLAALAPFGIVLWFFRDPERPCDAAVGVLLSPADGTVTDIEEVDEPEFIQGRAVRIGIFLSPFNVHVNRAPCAGTVMAVSFRAGEFLPAYNPQAPTRNEAVALALENSQGVRLIVKQITGVLARRIICEAEVGQALACGQRYGMIKFGSRTELYVPVTAQPTQLPALGTKVRGGLTPCCRVAPAAVQPQPSQGQGTGVLKHAAL